MKTLLHSKSAVIAVLLPFILTQSVLAESLIQLNGRKDIVLRAESRTIVLDVAKQHLNHVKTDAREDFLTRSAEAETPYAFDQPVLPIVDNDKESLPVEKTVIVYEDVSVLSAVAQNFAKQVRGTLARGSTTFLQLKGGNMIKPGTSFPVTIPQAQGQTFTVTISEITDSGYTLKLGEATQTISLTGSGTGSGATKLE